ncbi:MAG: sulfatase-like hydrolase/transferase [Planctomycetes bacterium]|nr:sulfatase-like hydrolase/transferase [Planctomycetota bacterium]
MAFFRNIIVVLPHGLRSDAVGDCRVWPLSTPNMEKLAARGSRLVASTACPADPGGMVSLLTGLHARQHGYVEPLTGPVAVEGWPSLLAESGYHVAGAGLVGAIEPSLREAVIVEPVDVLDSARCRYVAAMKQKGQWDAVRQQRRQRLRFGPFEPDRLMLEPDDDVDGFIAAEAARLLANMPEDKPWALVVCFTGPGNDLPPPPLYESVADRDALRAGYILADFTKLDHVAELDYPRVMLQRLEPDRLARIRADYLGRVALIDHGIGRLASTLETRGDAGRTWTVMSSDRGMLLGEHGLIGYRSFLAPAVEVPVIIAPPAPGRAEGAEEVPDGLVSTVDVAATIAALAACDVPSYLAGRSLLPTLQGDPVYPALHGGLVAEFGRRLMLETERYRLIFDVVEQRATGLYDLLNDPQEATNIVDSATGRNLLDSMRWRLGDALMPLRARPGTDAGVQPAPVPRVG